MIALFLLCVQNSALVLVTRYSRATLKENYATSVQNNTRTHSNNGEVQTADRHRVGKGNGGRMTFWIGELHF